MNYTPTPAEKEAMRQRYRPAKAKIIGYCVYQCGQAIYGPTTWGLCDYFMKLHGIKGKPREKREY